jgi:uncharacterized RDD family membrane protein YckC
VPTAPEDFPATGPNSLPPISHRMAARLIDLVVVTLPVAIITLTYLEVEDGVVRLDEVPWWMLGVQVGLAVVYETVALVFFGTTLGKWALGMKVVRYADGTRPDAARAAQRTLLPNVFAAVPVALIAALQWAVYATSAFHPLRRGFHDRYAGTLVVRSR